MPSTRRGKRANQLHSSVSADASGGSAEVDELHNVEEAGVESKYVVFLKQSTMVQVEKNTQLFKWK